MFWTCSEQDVPSDAPSEATPTIAGITGAVCACPGIRGIPSVVPGPHYAFLAFLRMRTSTSGRRVPTKGRVPLGPHTFPVRHSRWQLPWYTGVTLYPSCCWPVVLYILNCIWVNTLLHSYCTWSGVDLMFVTLLLLYNIHWYECTYMSNLPWLTSFSVTSVSLMIIKLVLYSCVSLSFILPSLIDVLPVSLKPYAG